MLTGGEEPYGVAPVPVPLHDLARSGLPRSVDGNGAARGISTACPGLTAQDGAAPVTATGAFVAKLFPPNRPPAALRELYARGPAIAQAFPPFRPARGTWWPPPPGMPLVR